NLAAKETARLRAQNKLIRYHYELNRLSEIEYPDSTPVTYEYGAPGEAGDAFGNIAARVKRETSEAGTKDYIYDRMGTFSHQNWSLVRLRAPTLGNNEAPLQYPSASFARLQTITSPAPGAEVVAYGYDRGGLVDSAVGVVLPAQPPSAPEPDTTLYFLH